MHSPLITTSLILALAISGTAFAGDESADLLAEGLATGQESAASQELLEQLEEQEDVLAHQLFTQRLEVALHERAEELVSHEIARMILEVEAYNALAMGEPRVKIVDESGTTSWYGAGYVITARDLHLACLEDGGPPPCTSGPTAQPSLAASPAPR